ncbi:hypothetical protein DFQ26_006257 [Actinomortierella ambigua]|nr:hypothetical protein DFQ26_006257 [Actinomortierella ambigua]
MLPTRDINVNSGRQTPTNTKMEEDDDEETRLTKEVALAMTTFSERAMVQQHQEPYGQESSLPTPVYEYPPRLEANGGSNPAPHHQAHQQPPAREHPITNKIQGDTADPIGRIISSMVPATISSPIPRPHSSRLLKEGHIHRTNVLCHP